MRLAGNLALALASAALAVGACELALALFAPVEFMRPAERLEGDAWRTYLHRPSEVPGLAYELAPNREGSHLGAAIRTNSHGMRDDEPAPAGSGVTRIAVVGDSVTFGFAVEGHETYAAVLQELLNADEGGRFEALNFGVGGYSTRDEALVVEHKVLAFEPRLVIVGYSLNDADPRPNQPLHQHFGRPRWWQHSNVLRLVARALEGGLAPLGSDYTASIHAPGSPTWASVVEGFGRIGELTRARGIPVLVAIFPRLRELGAGPYPRRAIHEQVAAAARAAGFHVLDLAPVFAKVPAPQLRNPRDPSHPSVLGHRVAAEAIHARLRAELELLQGLPAGQAQRASASRISWARPSLQPGHRSPPQTATGTPASPASRTSWWSASGSRSITRSS